MKNQKKAPLRVRGIVVKGSDVAGRVSPWSLYLDHISSQVAQEPGTEEALFIGQVKDTVGAQ